MALHVWPFGLWKDYIFLQQTHKGCRSKDAEILGQKEDKGERVREWKRELNQVVGQYKAWHAQQTGITPQWAKCNALITVGFTEIFLGINVNNFMQSSISMFKIVKNFPFRLCNFS